MPLLLSLTRESQIHDLGTHQAVEVTFDDLRVFGGPMLAKHRHNRWIAADGGDSYSHLEIEGPLVITGVTPDAKVLGPYQKYSMFDGVGYVDRRVCAFTDLQNGDWYVHDVGKHWPSLKIIFHETGP
jgi:hypothetical protein